MAAKKDLDCVSVHFDVFILEPDKDKRIAMYQAIRQDFALFRGAARKAASCLIMSQAAGCEIDLNEKEVRLTPDSDKSKSILLSVFGPPILGGEAKRFGYPMRPWIKSMMPNFKADMADAALSAVVSWYTNADQQFPKATKGWLALQGARRPPMFDRLPLSMRGPAAEKAEVKCTKRGFLIKYRTDIEFEVKLAGNRQRPAGAERCGERIDTSRWYIFKNIRDGKWPCKSAFLHMDEEGKLRVRLAYYPPAKKVSGLDPLRTLAVSFAKDMDQFICLDIIEGKKAGKIAIRNGAYVDLDIVRRDWKSAAAAIAYFHRLKAQQERYTAQLRSAGSRRDVREGFGHKKAADKAIRIRNALTIQRENAAKSWNDIWSKWVVKTATDWHCKNIVVFGPPKPVDPKNPSVDQGLLGMPWGWYAFKAMVEYKAKFAGVNVSFSDPLEAIPLLTTRKDELDEENEIQPVLAGIK